MMRGLFLPGLVCLVLCLNYASARRWSKEALEGLTCQDKCKIQEGNESKCRSEAKELHMCRCLPKKYVKALNASLGMPLEGPTICLYIQHVQRITAPAKCCDHYSKRNTYKKADIFVREMRSNPDEVKMYCLRLEKDLEKVRGHNKLICKIQQLRDASAKWQEKKEKKEKTA